MGVMCECLFVIAIQTEGRYTTWIHTYFEPLFTYITSFGNATIHFEKAMVTYGLSATVLVLLTINRMALTAEPPSAP